jgi:hypothetical protein
VTHKEFWETFEKWVQQPTQSLDTEDIHDIGLVLSSAVVALK